MVDFEAFPADESDFQGIKKLLSQLLLKADVNTSDLATRLIKNADTTTVLKQVADEEEDEDDDEPDDDVYGLSALVDLSPGVEAACVESLRKFLVDKAKQEGAVKFEAAARSALNAKAALLLNERFINLPARISLPCFEALAQDIREKPALDFDHFFLVMKVQQASDKKRGETRKASKKRMKVDVSTQSVAMKEKGQKEKGQQEQEDEATLRTKADDGETLFQNPEEEILCENATHSFQFSVGNQCDDDVRSGNWDEEDVKYRPFRRIVLLDRRQLLAAIAALRQELTGRAS